LIEIDGKPISGNIIPSPDLNVKNVDVRVRIGCDSRAEISK